MMSERLREHGVTFLAIVYAFTFSLPLDVVADQLEEGSISLLRALLVVGIFLIFLLFDWLLTSLLFRNHKRLSSLVVATAAVPFIGLSLRLMVQGNFYDDASQTITGLNCFFVFVALIFAYNIWEGRHLLDEFSELPGAFPMFFFIISLKIVAILILFGTTLLTLFVNTPYLIKWSVYMYVAYFSLRVVLDSIVLATYRVRPLIAGN